jgi:uncharacterized PurR-regulated membrane protein YhhQ (DUF165 family)
MYMIFHDRYVHRTLALLESWGSFFYSFIYPARHVTNVRHSPSFANVTIAATATATKY